MSNVRVERTVPVMVVTIDRPEARNAVDGPTAAQLSEAFRDFEADDELLVAVLTGAQGHFCAGADLKALAQEPERANRIDPSGDGPMGPSRMELSKPVIAAVEGYAVAGGLELAVWCDLRVASSSAVFGVFDRRWGVPLIDGGTIRLPRLIGQSRALDMILTGRAVDATEALSFGLVNRVTEPGAALEEAVSLAREIARFPQISMRADRRSALRQWTLDIEAAFANEFEGGIAAAMIEAERGATRFASGRGRHGDFKDL